MSDTPPPLPPQPPLSSAARSAPGAKTPRGFFPPSAVKAIAFYVITLCIVASVVVCILAIWDFARSDALWRLVASFLVVATGTALFTKVNCSFGDNS